MKTHPQDSDYVVESGATRNFEPWREKDEEADKEKRKREHEELGVAMKSLENRPMDSKREMDILAALDEMKSMKVTESAYYLGQLRWKNLATMVLSFGPAFAMVLPAHGKAESKTCPSKVVPSP